MDLLDLWAGRVTVRRLRVLLQHMPRDSALVTALSDGPAWTVADHLLALAVDHLAVANWQRTNVGRKRNKQTAFPVPVSRPGDRSREVRVMDENRLARLRARTGRS